MQNDGNITTEEKLRKLNTILAESSPAIIACSGGTDSMFLLHSASMVKNLRLMAVTISAPYMFSEEIAEAERFCRERNIDHKVIEMAIPESIRNNPEDRCYLCKKRIISLISAVKSEGNFRFVFDGTNYDDLNDFRPGMRALREDGVRSPLMEAGLTKKEIRDESKRAGLATWDKPANACLLTRFPHGTAISETELKNAEKAEEFVGSLGMKGSRVRIHGDIIRIECRNDQFETAIRPDTREQISRFIKSLGYNYITLDLEGYISGRMNIKKG